MSVDMGGGPCRIERLPAVCHVHDTVMLQRGRTCRPHAPHPLPGAARGVNDCPCRLPGKERNPGKPVIRLHFAQHKAPGAAMARNRIPQGRPNHCRWDARNRRATSPSRCRRRKPRPENQPDHEAARQFVELGPAVAARVLSVIPGVHRPASASVAGQRHELAVRPAPHRVRDAHVTQTVRRCRG